MTYRPSADRLEHAAEQRQKQQKQDGTYYGSTTTGATQPTYQQPQYYGGTPTAPQGYAPPPPQYYGGTPTSPQGYMPPPPQPLPIAPSFDYSDQAIAQRAAEQRQAAIDELIAARELESEAGPTGYLAVVPEGFEEKTPRAIANRAYIAYVMSLQDKRATNLKKYPKLAQAAIEAGANEQDVARLINYAEADAAAERVIAAMALIGPPDGTYYGSTSTGGTPQTMNDPAKIALGNRQIEMIMRSANPVMQMAIWDVVAQKIQEIEAPAGTSASSWADWIIEKVGVGLEAFFMPFEWANENVQRAIRAQQYGEMVEQGIYSDQTRRPSNEIPTFVDNIVQYWDKVGEGNYLPQVVAATREEYGDLATDLVLSLEEKARAGDPDPLISLFAENSSNPQAMAIIQQLLYKDGSSDVDLDAVARSLENGNLSNTGQLLVTSVLGDEYLGSVQRGAAAGAANVLITIGADPTIFAAKVRGAYVAARFALEKVAPGASRMSIEKAFQLRQTSRYFNSLFNKLDRYDSLLGSDPGRAAVLREQIRREFPELPDDVIDTFRSEGIRTTDDLVNWTVETNQMYLMQKGQVADGLIGEGAAIRNAPEPLAAAMYNRGAAVTRDALLPRMSIARRARSRFANEISRAMPSRRGQAVISQVYDNTSDTQRFVETISDVDNVMRAGQIERATMVNGQPGTFGKKVDSFFKWFSSVGIGAVSIKDGRDAKTVYRYARMFLSRRHAAYWADRWRTANPSQRYDMLIGLNRTAAAAKGIDLNDVEALARVDELVTPTKSTTSFSARSPVLSLSNDTDRAVLLQERDVLSGMRPDPSGARAALGPDGVIARIQEIDDELASLNNAASVPPTPPYVTASRDEVTNLTIPSRFADGSEKALFEWQTAEYVALPNMRDMEKLGRWQTMVRNMGGTWGDAILATPQTATDIWSLGTLFGLRYSIRQSLEDLWFYGVITGGNLADLYKGRRISTILRETRGRKREKAFGGKEVQALGMVNRRARAIGDRLEESQNPAFRAFGRWVRGNVDQNLVAEADAAARRGDFGPMRRLAAAGMAQSRLTGLSTADQEYVLDLVDGPVGLKMMDTLNETGKTASSGGFANDAVDLTVTEGTGVNLGALPRTSEGQRLVPVGDYTPELPLDGALPESFLYWERAINGVLLNDGPAGKIAVAYLDDPAEAVRRVAEEIRTDPTGRGYAWKFAALATESPEAFAARKVQAVRALFSDAQGNLNEDLWRKVVDRDRTVRAFTEAEDGTKSLIVDHQMLKRVPREMRPTYVSGQKYGVVPNADGLGPFMDRSWGWMGEQYARMSREPIFLANYIAHRRQLSAYQKQLAGKIGEPAARRVTARMAVDRAYSFSLSYMDNPQNRSLMAYKIRNFSRYYRATEDFYRRMMRAGKNYPVGLWKTALIYDVLDDTGFVYTNEDGEKYFMYPGTEHLMSAMNDIAGWVTGVEPLELDRPFVLGGKVTMLAPSADPNQLVASLAGPVGTVSYKMLARRFPAMQRLDRVFLGSYGDTLGGSNLDAILESILPAGFLKVANAFDEDERTSMLAAARADALKIAIANGAVPEEASDPSKFENSPELVKFTGQLDMWAWSAVITRFAFSLWAPASPQRFNNNVSDLARVHGSVDPRPAFLALVRKREEEGAENPIGTALADWFQMEPNMMPFTVSKTEWTGKGVRPAIKASQDVIEWFYQNREGLLSEYPQTAWYLAPQTEGFSWETWNLITAEGFRTPKEMLNEDGTPGPLMRDMFAAEGELRHNATVQDYMTDIEALDPRDPEQYSQIRDLEEQMSADLAKIREDFPWWGLKYSQTRSPVARQKAASDALTEVKRMVDELFESTPNEQWEGSAAYWLRGAIYTYVDYATEIKGIEGSDSESYQKKRMLEFNMRQDLNYIAEQNANAELFVRNVLLAEPDVSVLDFNLVEPAA